MADGTSGRGSSVLERVKVGADELAARSFGRLRENGFGGLEARERIVLSVVTTVLVGGFLLVVVLALAPRGETATSAPENSAVGQFASSSIVAAARAQSRLLSFDDAARSTALTEDVVPAQSDAVRAAFESGIAAVRTASGLPAVDDGSSATLSVQPSGYRMTYSNGNVSQVALWSQVTVDPTVAQGGDERQWWSTMAWTMRYTQDGWKVYSFDGSTNGPDPGAKSADDFTLLPGAKVS